MKSVSLIFSGFKLGMLLQLGGVGPICVLLFQLPAFLSLPQVLLGVLGVALADAIYVGLAVVGVAPLMQKIKMADRGLKIISGLILIALGLFFVSMVGQEARVISVAIWLEQNIFWGLFLLTMMNPATIIIFTGIFAAEVAGRKLDVKELSAFAAGVILTTPFFLGLVAIFGSFSYGFLPIIVVKILNAIVGLILIYWGFSRFLPKLKILRA